jgi:hypothetical protein
MNARIYSFAVLLLCSVMAAGDDKSNAECTLSTAKNGQTVTLRGQVRSTAHDMLLILPNCESGIVLQYAGDPETETSAGQLKRNSDFKRFGKYTSATYKSTGKNLCMQCSMYEVEATLTGRLDVANVPEGTTRDQLGFARDSSGRIVGKVGWGHPTPVYKYRLVIESVSNVVARKLPGPNKK